MAAGAPAGLRTAGRAGGKSGLHGNRAPGNARRGSHVPWDVANLRESATESRPPAVAPRHWQARVKGCGKSAPRLRQRGWHGKPRPEQGRIGAARPAFCRAGHVSGPAARVGRARRMATCVPDEWSSPAARGGGQNPAYRLAGHFFPVIDCHFHRHPGGSRGLVPRAHESVARDSGLRRNDEDCAIVTRGAGTPGSGTMERIHPALALTGC